MKIYLFIIGASNSEICRVGLWAGKSVRVSITVTGLLPFPKTSVSALKSLH